jgi:cytochrome c oxidase subunit 2
MAMTQIAKWTGRAAIALALAAQAPLALAQTHAERWQLNMTPGVTETARTAYEMHMIMLWICVVIGIVVFGAMFVAMFRFRKSSGAKADTSFVHSTKLEILWTVIPIVILVVMAWPATRSLILMMDTKEAEMTVKVTGYQWKWRYQVLDYRGAPQDLNFISSLAYASNKARMMKSGVDPDTVENYLLEVDRELVLPTDTKIRFLLSAEDVIHAWWVPALGWKQDAIPGFVNEAWTRIDTPGTYRGQCAELCGKDHGFMPIVVRAVPRAEFEQWLAANGGTPPAGGQLAATTTPAVPAGG